MAFSRIRFLTALFALLLLGVEGRLVYLQFVVSDFWRVEGEKSRNRAQTEPFRRGGIYDRFGLPLAVGEIDQSLLFVYQDFRRDTPLGLLLGSTRLLVDELDEPLPLPTLRDVLQAPDVYAWHVLSICPADLGGLRRLLREDYLFYARRLLGLSEREFRELREEIEDPSVPFHEMVDGAIDQVVAKVREQSHALMDMAEAIQLTPSEFFDSVEEQIRLIDENFVRSVALRSKAPSFKELRSLRRDHESRPRKLSSDIPYRAVFHVNLVPERFSGFVIKDVDSRHYPDEFASVSPLLLGWVGAPFQREMERSEQNLLRYRELQSRRLDEIDADSEIEIHELLEGIRYDDYLVSEQRGREGLEALLEPVLRGRRGRRVVLTDSSLGDTELLEQTRPQDGTDVTLTLDARLQLAAQEVLEEYAHPSALVLLEPRTGAIRALATWPLPDRETIKKSYGDLLNDPRGPLHHRAFRPPGNPPPPGSVFKIVTAAAALEAGAITSHTQQDCRRYFHVGDRDMRCLGSHGPIDVSVALAKSCNIFFYKTARDVGLERVVDMAARFGLDSPSRFGDPEFLGLGRGAVEIEEMWWPRPRTGSYGDLLLTVIGHGAFDDITPLQVATMVAPIANGGYRVQPWLIDRIGAERAPRAEPERIGLSPATLTAIRRGMERVTALDGTAHPRAGFDLRVFRVAGKTGTPQGGGGVLHAWFAGYFPYDSPKLVFAFFAEGVTTGGGTEGTPLLGRLLEHPELERYL